MSHIATVQIEIKSLEDLEAACKSLGLEFARDQRTYRWYGASVGDYPLPAGFEVHELGLCDHAIRVPREKEIELLNKHGQLPYEVGVCRRRDGQPGHVLLWDFFSGGYGMQGMVGENGNLLKQAYATQAARRTMLQQGYRCQETRLANGSIQLQFVR